jgi:hypothetical protein
MFSKLTSFARQGGDQQDEHKQPQEQSLITILPTPDDRAELLTVIVNSMEAMRKQIQDVFDPDKTGDDSALQLLSKGSLGGGEITTNTETLGARDASFLGGDTTNTTADDDNGSDVDASVEKVAKEREGRVKEVREPEMLALNDAVLNHFDAWRDRVAQRTGEAINQRPEAGSEQQQHSSQKSTLRHDSTTIQGRVKNDDEANTELHKLYPPQESSLRKLPRAQRVLILHCILLLLLSLESYTAESRVLMLRLASSLSLPLSVLSEDETRVAKGLLEAAKQMNADKETKEHAEAGSTARNWKVGLAAAGGAVLIGVTGGLAAPLIAAGVGTVMGGIGLGATATAGYLGALAGSAPLVGVLFGAYGGRMTGRMVDVYAKEVEDFAFIPVRKPGLLHGKDSEKDNRHLRIAIGVSGYLTEEAEVVLPWQVIGNSVEGFALRWELKALLNLGNSLTSYIKSYAWGWMKKEIISRTIFAALSSAVASALTLPYGFAKAARIVDNPFSVARSRSEKAGKVLADALINKVQGERPVTLIGYSLGARVIYTCLTELANRKAFGLIESVVLIGAATPSDSVFWRKLRSVVAGRVINVYSSNDYLLAFMYRTSSLQYGVAGLQPIRDVQAIENVDVSDIVDGHTQYRFLIGVILERVGLEDIDHEVVKKQMARFKIEQDRVEAERAKQEAENKSPEDEVNRLESEVAQKNKATQAYDWVSSKMSDLKVSATGERKVTTTTPSPEDNQMAKS